MILNFLRIALRQFTKHKVYSLINVLGLSMGLCCFILLSLFINRELSFDSFQTNKENIYQMYLADSAAVEGPFSYTTMAPMGPEVMASVPEITNFTRFGKTSLKIITDQKSFEVKGLCYTDASTFDIFDINIIAGNAPGKVFSKQQILISKEEALRLYESVDEAIGKIIEIPDLEKLEVIGVFENMPENSHLGFEMLMSFDHANELLFYGSGFNMPGMDVMKWGKVSAYITYYQTTGPIDVEAVELKIQQFMLPHTGEKEVKLMELEDIYLSEYNPGYFRDKGDMKELKLFVAVGLILLLIAVVNYMNLSTARFSKRAKEVGIRKTIGGHRNQLVFQFLVESLTITTFALVVGLMLAEMAMPYFNNYTDKVVDIDYTAPLTYFYLLGTILLVGLVSGLYPAFYLSKFSAKQNLIGGSGKDKSIFRKVLVGVQFAICLGLISSTFILFSQHQHMRNIDMGFNTDQMLIIELDKVLKKSAVSIKNELKLSPNIEDVMRANISPLSGGAVTMGISVNDDQEISSSLMSVESGLIKMLEVEAVQGSLFADLQESEIQSTVLVNEAFVREAGWDEPLGKKLLGENKIVGVVKDFIYESAKSEIKPTVIMQKSDADDYLYLRMVGDVGAGLKHIEKTLQNFDADHVFDYTFLDDVFAAKYEKEKRLGEVFGLFSIFTIFIAGLGVLGLSIFIAESRIKEIGIRKVLGARLAQVVWLLNSGITILVLIVALATIPAVYHFTERWLDGFAYRIDLNPFHFILPLLALLGIIWSILFYQSYKSANANPVNALRIE
ncbi:MAG: FtsX-like permease family protein [Roseivirga sp.]|nr:FtsX-like permease family protein [Roseivirga sp.]